MKAAASREAFSGFEKRGSRESCIFSGPRIFVEQDGDDQHLTLLKVMGALGEGLHLLAELLIRGVGEDE